MERPIGHPKGPPQDSQKRHEPAKTMALAIESVYRSSKYSDLTILCSGKEFRVHRSIVCPQSSFFEAACDGGFKESHTGIINLEGDDLSVIKCMIDYLYTGDYESRTTEIVSRWIPASLRDRGGTYPSSSVNARGGSITETDPIETLESVFQKNLRVFAVADKYGIPGLRTISFAKIESRAKCIGQVDLSVLGDAATYAFEITSNTDDDLNSQLRTVMILALCDKVEQQGKYRKLEAKLEEEAEYEVFGEVGANVIKELIKRRNDMEEKIPKAINTAMGENLRTALANLNTALSSLRHCRHEPCIYSASSTIGSNMRVQIEQRGSLSLGNFGFLVRCSSCRTRHPVDNT